MTQTPEVIRSANSNKFCVPAALSVLLRRHVDEVMPLIAEHLGEVQVQGIYCGVTLRILKDQGYNPRELHYADQFKLHELVKRLKRNIGTQNITYFTTIRAHALVIVNSIVYDNGNPKGIDVMKYYKRNAQVEQCWEVTK